MHVFAISSHLTFYVSKHIIELDHIAPDDCVLLLTRNYHIPPQYESQYPHQIHTTYNVDPQSGRVFAGANIMQTYKNIRDFDQLVDPYIQGREFTYYTQVCSNDITSLMVTKPNCKGFFVIEDGLSSYRKFNPQTFEGARYWVYKLVLRPFFNRIFSAKNHFISSDHPKFMGCIATQQRCFPLHQDCLRVIGMPFEKIQLDVVPDAILSVDPLYDKISDQQMDQVYARIRQFMDQFHYQKVAYKLHPRFDAPQNHQHREDYLQMLRRHFGEEMIALPSSVVLENMLFTHPAAFYSLNSSVSVYASMMGSQCYTYMPLLKNTPAYEENWILEESTSPINPL